MFINEDLTLPAVLDTSHLNWEASPAQGVSRKMLDRAGGEVARATSIVKFAPNSYFPRHVHSGGEEFLVLDGTFSDEHGDYPIGTYVRNPIGTSHSPYSENGCTIFVKLHQFDPADTKQVSIETFNTVFKRELPYGVAEHELHTYDNERCSLLRMAPKETISKSWGLGGAELIILEGSLSDGSEDFGSGTWFRDSGISELQLISHTACLFYLKTGHLPANQSTRKELQ